MRHAAVLLISLILATALAAGCGSDPTATPTPTEPPPAPEPTDTPAPGTAVTSEIAGFMLEDLTITVGTTVAWKNLDSAPHTATSGESPAADGMWDTASLRKDQSAEPITFNETGTFAYFCTIHPNMTATLTVTE